MRREAEAKAKPDSRARDDSGLKPASGPAPSYRGDAVPTAAELGLPESPGCPFCDGTETELHAPFGSALSVATYWCRACRTAFEWIKWE